MDEEFLINIVIAGKKYPLTIKRHEEELARAAADQINSKIRCIIWSWKNGMIQILLRIRYRSLQLSWKDI